MTYFRNVIPSLFFTILLFSLFGCSGSSSTLNTSDSVTTTPSFSSTPEPKMLLVNLPEQREVVYFEKDSFELNIENQQALDPIAIRLRLHPDSHLIVIGHSDDNGSNEYNLTLSFERAFSVAIYISSVFGIEEERIQLVALGNDEPLSMGNSEQAKQQNRRVEVISPKAIVRTLSTITGDTL
ncbi:OmpA family protein [Photobacterium sagamiensis]|uniref:OmpA family protein n=1 Tax=Photobacterium sagamiensis TaxID=2910241 RepID=UPI003D0B4261